MDFLSCLFLCLLVLVLLLLSCCGCLYVEAMSSPPPPPPELVRWKSTVFQGLLDDFNRRQQASWAPSKTPPPSPPLPPPLEPAPKHRANDDLSGAVDLLRLPDDILGHVLTYLTLKEIAAVLRVNKELRTRINTNIEYLWARLYRLYSPGFTPEIRDQHLERYGSYRLTLAAECTTYKHVRDSFLVCQDLHEFIKQVCMLAPDHISMALRMHLIFPDRLYKNNATVGNWEVHTVTEAVEAMPEGAQRDILRRFLEKLKRKVVTHDPSFFCTQ